MGYFPVRYDSRVVIYDRRGFIRLATGHSVKSSVLTHFSKEVLQKLKFTLKAKF